MGRDVAVATDSLTHVGFLTDGLQNRFLKTPEAEVRAPKPNCASQSRQTAPRGSWEGPWSSEKLQIPKISIGLRLRTRLPNAYGRITVDDCRPAGGDTTDGGPGPCHFYNSHH